ncbi:DEAD/DEAH box helicase family protein [candidate division KSB1 bacterium]|nr:DEAD/DEAH box helicase family protein [candidate division KSB1 bacterium]
MFELKDYQEKALARLKEYFTEVRQAKSSSEAFEIITKEYYDQKLPYRTIEGLEDLPYVCFRIPTGGGKTLVACHTINITQKELLFSGQSMVLWLVPTNPIREQTLKALKNPQHPYRQALELELGPVNILDIQDSLYVNRSTLLSGTTIIVSTIQAFRIDDTEGRRVYAQNGHLKEHFDNIQSDLFESIELNPDGKPLESLANLIRIHRPIVIVDEAHNARTDLSFSTLAKFDPSCILEFTATPQTDSRLNPSNILYTVSASELSAENMIKMPIWLETQPDWERLLADAIQRLNTLQSSAIEEQTQTGEYIRPIMLIQAQPKSKTKDTLTVDVIKDSLVNIFNIPESNVIISIGALDELGNTDLSSPECPIRFIITVQKLKEGWDCPFAYVLCSVAEIASGRSIEQILGRVLRLPYASEKNNPDLNKAYAYVASPHFEIVLNKMKDAVIQNGFEKQDAEDLVTYHKKSQQLSVGYYDTPLFGQQVVSIQYSGDFKPTNLDNKLQQKITFNTISKTISVNQALSIDEKENIKSCLNNQTDQVEIESLFIKSLNLGNSSPAQAGVDFSIPVLSIRQGDLFETFEEQHLLDYEWSLLKCSLKLTEVEYSKVKPGGKTGEIYYAKGHVLSRFISRLDQQIEATFPDLNQSIPNLVHWLDQNFSHTDISQNETDIFITGLVNDLIQNRCFNLAELYFDRFNLLKAVVEKINFYRSRARKTAYQELLFSGNRLIGVSPDTVFSYDPNPGHYPVHKRFDGDHEFQKHYYPIIGDMNSEEFLCAQHIDNMNEVLFWVRNIERKADFSFWLQTSTDKFYPDFVCQLKNGRFLVVEHKGGDRLDTADTKEKKALGELWELRSNGKCLFVMTTGNQFQVIDNKINNS